MPAHGDQYKSIENPFEDAAPRVNSFTAQEIATLQVRLNKQLGPEYVSTRPGAGGGKVAYLAAEKAINLANEVFGFNGWSSSIQQVQIDFVDENPSSGKISLGLSIIVRVTLKDGTFHEDVGYGHIENCKGKAAAFEKAKKEAATDALKRALRTFGNVLGNCLYDKDYLKKVGGMKAPPSKWDAERLHRHPDFVSPVKKEDSGNVAEKETKILRMNTEQSVVSTGTEFEDEFGGNLFDGMEITENQGDEFTFDEHTNRSMEAPQRVQQHPGPQTHQNHLTARQAMSRVQSMPAIRHQNSPQNVPQQYIQQGRPPPHSGGPPHTPHGNPNIRPNMNQGRMQPAQNGLQQQNRGPQNQPVPNQGAKQQPQSAAEVQTRNDIQRVSTALGAPVPHEPSVGFVTSRAAELVQNPETNKPLPPNLPSFNPKAESPSIRRTSGIDHTSSKPVSRQSGPGGNQLKHVDPVQQSKPNFVNPQNDAGRRIGMPMAAQSPLANRSAYKAPTMAAGMKRGPDTASRAPLADVSNKQADGAADAGDTKRIRQDGSESSGTVVS